MTRKPTWARSLEKNPPKSLRDSIARLEKAVPFLRTVSDTLPEQPFDEHLLNLSPLYRRSRNLYRKAGGEFRATLVSSPRTLSSPILLSMMIEYSPIERELVWAATDPIEKKNKETILRLRTYSSSLFHEQSHRILWKLLPSAPTDRASLRRYLNYAESLVVAADMALGDELGPALARIFYSLGVIYDPGTEIRREVRSKREYRNYLQAAMFATYLNMELYDPREIGGAIRALFPGLNKLADRASKRALNLDRAFVEKTSPTWQSKHRRQVITALSGRGGKALELPEDPMDNRVHYLFAEKWFEAMEL